MTKEYNYTLNKKWQTGKLVTKKNTFIRWALYCNSKTFSPKKFILFLNGRTEYIEKYNYIVEDLKLSSDIGFLTFDHQGQGCSSGRSSHIETYDQYQFDCHSLIQTIVKDKPYILMAHSMGALITLYGVLSGVFKPEKIFLLSPFLGISKKRNALPFLISKYLVYILSSIGLRKTVLKHNTAQISFEKNRQTSCPVQYERILHSPYVPTEPTIGWISASYQALETIYQKKSLASITCPIDIIIAKQDQLVCNQDALRWTLKAQQYSSAPCISAHFLEGQHELLSEKKEFYLPVIQKLQSWIQQWNQN